MTDRNGTSVAALRNERFERLYGKPRGSSSTQIDEDELLRRVQGSAQMEKLRQMTTSAARRATPRGALSDKRLECSTVKDDQSKGKAEANNARRDRKGARFRADESGTRKKIGAAGAQVSEEEQEVKEAAEAMALMNAAKELFATEAKQTAAVGGGSKREEREVKEAAEATALMNAAKEAFVGESRQTAAKRRLQRVTALTQQLDAEQVEPPSQQQALAPASGEALRPTSVAASGSEQGLLMCLKDWRSSKRGQAFRKEQIAKADNAKQKRAYDARSKVRDDNLDKLLGLGDSKEPTPLALLLGTSPPESGSNLQRRGRQRSRRNVQPPLDFSYEYPTSEELAAQLGARAEFRQNVHAHDEATGGEPPRNPQNMVACEGWVTG